MLLLLQILQAFPYWGKAIVFSYFDMLKIYLLATYMLSSESAWLLLNLLSHCQSIVWNVSLTLFLAVMTCNQAQPFQINDNTNHYICGH